MKLLFLLVFLPLCISRCPPNHYKDDVFNKCEKCTPCHFTLTPCSADKDAVCAPINIDNPSGNHHFLKDRLHFLDDTVGDSQEDDIHAKNFLPHQKDQHKKNSKHPKAKTDEKHHHKKKHYEFDDDEDDDDTYDNYNDDFDFNFDKIEKPKKHSKKHYEFSKKHNKNKKDKEFFDEDLERKLDSVTKKDKKKTTHPKKVSNIDEEQLEEWLIQSEKKLKIRKDNLLKTLKDEKRVSEKQNKVRLNSPVLNLSDDESFDSYRSSSGEGDSKSDALKALADLHPDDEDSDDLGSILPIDEESYKPVPIPPKVSKKTASQQLVGQGKDVDELIRSEMGKNVIFEKSRFNVIPFVVGKDFNPEKKSFSSKYGSTKKEGTQWKNTKDNEEYQEIKMHEVVSLPFSAAETLVWDWQAIALASAVAACLVFFLVVAAYFIINTRHWKKTSKGYYHKEIDELSSRVALMQPMLEMGAQDSRYYIYMDTTAPIKEDGKKGDVKL